MRGFARSVGTSARWTAVESRQSVRQRLERSPPRIAPPTRFEGRDVLREELVTLGGIVTAVVAYRTVKPIVDISPLRARLKAGEISMVTFASPSAVRNYLGMFNVGEGVGLHASVAIAVIGGLLLDGSIALS